MGGLGVKVGFSKDVKELARRAFRGYCWLCDRPGVDVHHRLANTVGNNRTYPLLLHSIFNAAFLCRDCHDNRKHELDIPESVARVYELFLQKG